MKTLIAAVVVLMAGCGVGTADTGNADSLTQVAQEARGGGRNGGGGNNNNTPAAATITVTTGGIWQYNKDLVWGKYPGTGEIPATACQYIDVTDNNDQPQHILRACAANEYCDAVQMATIRYPNDPSVHGGNTVEMPYGLCKPLPTPCVGQIQTTSCAAESTDKDHYLYYGELYDERGSCGCSRFPFKPTP